MKKPSAYKDFMRQSGERDDRGVKMPTRGTRIADFGPGLKGLGGLQTAKIRALKGSKFGPANEGKRLSKEQSKAIEDQMRKDGKL